MQGERRARTSLEHTEINELMNQAACMRMVSFDTARQVKSVMVRSA